jgi:amino acid transporter
VPRKTKANSFFQIDTRWSIPLYTIALTGIINALLGLLYLANVAAFNAVVSLTTASYLSSYLIPIVLMILRRLRGGRIRFGPWTLGRWGLPINIFAAVYTFVTVVFSFFPANISEGITAENMNYSCLVYGGVIMLGIVYYAAIGHRGYKGPSLDVGLGAM